MVAEAKTLIRGGLTGYGNFLDVTDILNEMMQRRGYDDFIAELRQAGNKYGNEYVLLSGEVAWAVGEAIRELEAESEIRKLGKQFDVASVKLLGSHLGFATLAGPDYTLEGRLGATPKGIQRLRFVGTQEIRWDQVQSLLDEVRRAHLSGLAVLSAVGARIVAEEAVRSALEELGVPEDDQPNRPWKRESTLFDKYLANAASAFEPMDQTSTQAVLSATRSYGNEVAHSGRADDAHLNELYVSILPQALQSLSAAVSTLL